MARKDCLPATGAGEHASSDPLRIFSGNAWGGGRGGSGDRIRNRLLVSGQALGSHGRGWPASAVSGRLVAGHHFLFSWHVFLLQNDLIEIRKSLNGQIYVHVSLPA